jgi:hypothetical protein
VPLEHEQIEILETREPPLAALDPGLQYCGGFRLNRGNRWANSRVTLLLTIVRFRFFPISHVPRARPRLTHLEHWTMFAKRWASRICRAHLGRCRARDTH